MLQENPSTIFNVNVFVISFVGLTNSKMGINSYLGDKQMEKNYPNIFKARFFSGLSLTSSLNMSSILISWFFCLIFFFFFNWWAFLVSDGVGVPAYAICQPGGLGFGFVMFFFLSLICLVLDFEQLLFLFSLPFPIYFYLLIDCVPEKQDECT